MQKLTLLLALTMTACAQLPDSTPSNQLGIDTHRLLSGHTAITDQLQARRPRGSELFETSPEMLSYLRRVAVGNSPVERLNSVLANLREQGFELEYDLNQTASAAEAFSQRRGNCVSFAAMVVSMARHLGVEARLNQAMIPVKQQLTAAENGSGYVQNIRHVNAVVEASGRRYIIEEGFRIFVGKDINQLTDRQAQAIYLNNLAMEAIREQDYDNAFHYSREAILNDDDASYLWVGLGVAYRRSGELELAEQSYRQALALNAKDSVARNNLKMVRQLIQQKQSSGTAAASTVDAEQSS